MRLGRGRLDDNGLSPHPPRRQRHELLAGLRRRVVDADPEHHLHPDRIRGGAVLFAAGSRRQGHRADPPQRADRPAHRTAVDGENRQGQRRGPACAAARFARRRRERSRQVQRACRWRRRGSSRCARQSRRAFRPARQREEDFLSRAGAGRNPQPADRGHAPAARRHRVGARCFREEGQGIPEQDRRSRPTAQFSAWRTR